MRPAVEAEKLGIASVVIATSGFTQLARILAKSTGIDDLRIAEYPGPMGIDTPVQMSVYGALPPQSFLTTIRSARENSFTVVATGCKD